MSSVVNYCMCISTSVFGDVCNNNFPTRNSDDGDQYCHGGGLAGHVIDCRIRSGGAHARSPRPKFLAPNMGATAAKISLILM